MVTAEEANSNAPRRAVLLGASNLAVGLPTIFPAVQRAWGRPVEILAAIGHGRGYGCESRVLGRVLPPIIDCGLWEALEERPGAETAVLLTDIGNDLVLGATAEQLVTWVETCLSRLPTDNMRVTITELPLVSLEKMGKWRFLFFRTFLFPGSRLGFQEALDAANYVNAALQDLARQYNAQTVRPLEQWYGFDPIHIRRSQRPRAWQHVFGEWNAAYDADNDRVSNEVSRPSAWYLYRLRPLERKFFLMHQHKPQPAGCLPDGSTISLF